VLNLPFNILQSVIAKQIKAMQYDGDLILDATIVQWG
jgi:hypothetical protein